MVLVDIYVPAFDKEYDFSLNEKTMIHALLEEIAEVISLKEQCEIQGNLSDLLLCSSTSKEILPGNKTLENCGIQTGHRLILL